MVDIETVFGEIASLSLDSAEVRMDELTKQVSGEHADPITIFGYITDLVDAGQIETWEKQDGSIVIYLTPLSADRLGVKLLPDSSRWVAKRAKQVSPRIRPNRIATAETDLDDETGIPLDQRADPRARQPIDEDEMWERIAERRAYMSGMAPERLMKKFDRLKPPEVVMMGVLPYPHPGHPRGEQAPLAIPQPEDIRKDWKLAWVAKYPKTCYACKGLPLPSNTLCEPCGRLGTQHRYQAVIVKEGREEVEEASKAWEVRAGEIEEENARAVAEIMSWGAGEIDAQLAEATK